MMDINLAQTFLEIASTRSFVRAAERMHLTQVAVSARVKAIETLRALPAARSTSTAA
jgi:DNA-binding transcriptional LysR family regulator